MLLLKKYKKYLERSKIKLPLNIWLGISLVIALGIFILTYFLFENYIISLVSSIAILDIILGYPIYKEESRVLEIEKHLPDALREMADILKSGGTYEYAIREIITLDFGPLSKEFEKVLIRLEEGSNFEDSLRELTRNVDSELVAKIIDIIIDSLNAGAGLSDVLEEIATDAREIYRLEEERRAKTTMQVLFIFAAGAIIAPAIFGLIMTIVKFLINVSAESGISSKPVIYNAIQAREKISSSLQIYLFFESIISSFIISLMRDKTLAKTIFYFPIFLLISFIIYYLSMFVSSILLTGLI